ncbi:MAG TPA: GMC family oxidoreductase [Solirubrobacterales bacterium]|nr:GMC family oxidoreductase [Solirubrobacterales bacterium]
MSAAEHDVLVVGSGAAGAAISWRLASRGARVVCLEQGDWVSPDTVPKQHLDWEVRGRHYWNFSPAIRRGPSDFPLTNEGPDPVDCYFFSAVGGSTVGFGAQYWRLLPSDFRTRTLDEFGVDWPFGYDELAPYYDINEREVGVSGMAGDPTGPERPDPPLPPTSPGRLGQRWIDGFERLGWAWWPQDNAIVSRDYEGRGACVNRNFCAFGCPSGSRSSADVSYWPKALKQGVELRTNATVAELTLNRDGSARGAIYYDAEGAAHEVRANRVVVCAGGVGTPRLLLMSASPSHPDGLANGSGLVGRNFMVHVQSIVVARFEERIDAHAGAIGVVSSRQFYETDPANDFKRGFIVAGNRGYSPLLTALQHREWGEDHHRSLEGTLNHEAAIYVCGDDEPDPGNLVELNHGELDRHGLPGVRTHYELSDNSRKLGETAIGRGRELGEAAGATSVRDFGLSPILGWHLLGTCRMGDDPRSSVTAANNECHEVPNLFVADGSSLPTGGAINPANTIQAIALRAADRIWEGRNGH